MGKNVVLSIDLKPALDEERLDRRLLRDLDEQGKRQFHTILKGLMPRKLIPVCIDFTGIPSKKPGHQITARERKRVLEWMKDFRLKVSGYRPFTEAIITAGGVTLKEINPRTMASKLIEGLYFAGEVMDIDGDTGGFNLQAAFSTGTGSALRARNPSISRSLLSMSSCEPVTIRRTIEPPPTSCLNSSAVPSAIIFPSLLITILSEVAWASTVNGYMDVSMGSMDWEELEFSTVSGDITIRLPAGIDTDVRFSSLSGDFDSDFDLSDRTEKGRWIGSRVRGTIGDGGRTLRLKTVSGDVAVLRSR